MAETVLATLGYPVGDNRGQRSGSRPRKRRKRGDVEHIHFHILLIAGSLGLSNVAVRSDASGLLPDKRLALCSNTDRHALLRSDMFCLKQCSTLVGSGM